MAISKELNNTGLSKEKLQEWKDLVKEASKDLAEVNQGSLLKRSPALHRLQINAVGICHQLIEELERLQGENERLKEPEYEDCDICNNPKVQG